MKKNIFKSALISFVLLSSMSSYLYLNCCAVNSLADIQLEVNTEEMEQRAEEESLQLPDLTIIERSVDFIKMILPTN